MVVASLKELRREILFFKITTFCLFSPCTNEKRAIPQCYIFMTLFLGLIWDASLQQPACTSCPVPARETAVGACSRPLWPPQRDADKPCRLPGQVNVYNRWDGGDPCPPVVPLAVPPPASLKAPPPVCTHLFLNAATHSELIVHSCKGLNAQLKNMACKGT